jgi:membrane-associated protein
MNLTDQILSALVSHGIPLLFGVVVLASIGAPLPITLMLIACGSFAKQGQMHLSAVILAGSGAAVLGDQIGYGLSRWGGRKLIGRITRRFGGAEKIEKAEKMTRKWGGVAIFFSRWLVTELGPWINVTSGISGYPWARFVLWDVLGEVLWVVLYVMLGFLFSDHVQYIAQIMGNLAWAILALIVAGVLGWKLFRYFRPAASSVESAAGAA